LSFTYHMVPCEYFEAQPQDKPYRPEPMVDGREEFIHCTDGEQNLADTGNRFYKGDPRSFYALLVDLEKLTAPFKYEDSARIFPHIYGALNRDAIIAVLSFPRAEDGTFLPPA